MPETQSVLIPEALRPLLVPLASLTPYPKNAQKHDDKSVEQMVKALLKWGWTDPCITWPHDGKTYFAAGHRRNLAALKLGLAEIPALSRPEWTEAEFRAYVIWDNQSVKQEPWDLAILKDELVDLDGNGFDLSLMGFQDSDVERMLAADDAARESAEDIRPISQIHVMLSFAPEQMAKLAPLIEQAKTIGAEVEQGHT